MDRTRRDSQALNGVATIILTLAGFVAIGGALSGCASTHKGEAAPSAELTEVAHLMTGTFSNADQAAADPQFYDVRLHMVPIWHERHDGVWLYVEQAMSAEPKHPYRQRVYHLHEPQPGVYVSDVYLVPDEKKWVGMWEKPHKFSSLKIEELIERDGCAITLRRESDGVFTGGTEGTGCASDLRGASHATSQVRINAQCLETWDRGFDAAGAQVWGSTTGPYRFLRTIQE